MIEVDREPLFYCGDEVHQAKLTKVQAALRARDLDGLLLLKHDAVRYVTEFYAKGYRPFLGLEYAALVPRSRDPVLGFTLAGEERRAAIRSRVSDYRRLPSVSRWAAALAEILRDYGLTHGHVGFDFMPHFIHAGLRAALPHLELVDASEVWSDLTAIKHPLEVDLIRGALQIAQVGMAAAIEAIRRGVTELEVSAAGEHAMRLLGSEMNPFIPVVASGPNAAIWERLATQRQIHPGEMVILDFGCVYRGYTGDFARTVITGNPRSEQRALYRAAYDALHEAANALRPGVLCSEVDRVVREVIAVAGFGKYTATWASGHQLGYGLHGEPVIGPNVDVPLQPGMVVNLEPALYTYDDLLLGGVELEDSWLITNTGAERLTDSPYDEHLLD